MKFMLWKYPVHFLAYGFGTGLAPLAPGTFGSLVGALIRGLVGRAAGLLRDSVVHSYALW